MFADELAISRNTLRLKANMGCHGSLMFMTTKLITVSEIKDGSNRDAAPGGFVCIVLVGATHLQGCN